MTLMYATGANAARPVPAKCHGRAGCDRPAIGWVRLPGPGRLWIPVCGKDVGPWTIQGAEYRGPRG